jgi:hypothetical protein
MWKICHSSQDYIGEISENKLWSTGHFPWLWNIKQKITQLKVLIVSGVYEINITLDFHIHCTFFIFVFFCVQWLKVRGSYSFCGYLWNCYWPLLFKISFHMLNYIMFGRGIFCKYPSQYDVFFANTPPNMMYLFNCTEYYLKYWLNKINNTFCLSFSRIFCFYRLFQERFNLL